MRVNNEEEKEKKKNIRGGKVIKDDINRKKIIKCDCSKGLQE